MGCEETIESNLSDSYKDFQDLNSDFGAYWFGSTYETFEPYWNAQNCRSKGNIYISKQCTNDLRNYVDEKELFGDNAALYYKFDYTVAMQIVDRQTVYFHLADGRKICLMNTDLHKNGNDLYAVIVPNTEKRTKQRWKVIDYKNDISKAFMTADQLQNECGIHSFDLPKGSRAFHNNWQAQKHEIVITKDLINKR